MENNLKQIKNIVIATLSEYNSTLDKIYLFGSKVTGFTEQISDYDLLLVIKNDLDRKMSLQIMKKIRERLARFYIENKIPAVGTDIILHSKKEMKTYRKSMGTITYQVLKEGVLL